MKYSSRREQRVDGKANGSWDVQQEQRFVHRRDDDARQAEGTEIAARCRGRRDRLGYDHQTISEHGTAPLRDGDGHRTSGGSAAAAQDAVLSGRRRYVCGFPHCRASKKSFQERLSEEAFRGDFQGKLLRQASRGSMVRRASCTYIVYETTFSLGMLSGIGISYFAIKRV